ncbi:hypothetical protein OF83DRAFT_1161020 [Amylostereum chailletii]|nr:hypothetical protein OF83DRAFT_1161020 [Amylostereum chailletii]
MLDNDHDHDHDSLPGPSNPPPPSFEDSLNHTLLDLDALFLPIPDGGEAPPPAFAPYQAEHWISNNRTIISHDPHLNKDGEALYRFLLSQAREKPNYVLHCRGSHSETHTRYVQHTNSRGQTETRRESDQVQVTDFDWCLDLTQFLLPDNTLWTAPDNEPVYRGQNSRALGVGRERVRAPKPTVNALKKLLQHRQRLGLPPWVGSVDVSQPENGDRELEASIPFAQEVPLSSWTLRQWANDYCSSPKIFKEFAFEKIVYGWNTESLTMAVRNLITATTYRGDIQVEFETSLSKVVVRPDTRLSRALSNGWLKFLLIITLIYPFIWLFQTFHPQGSGRWTVAGSAYALKRANRADLQTKTRTTEGLTERAWFSTYASTMRRLVYSRVISTKPVYHPDGDVDDLPYLDG